MTGGDEIVREMAGAGPVRGLQTIIVLFSGLETFNERQGPQMISFA